MLQILEIIPLCVYAERPICAVQLQNNHTWWQLFYRSTGKNSHLKDVWLPFNGMTAIWFIKEFIHPVELVKYDIYHFEKSRFGHPLLKEVSDRLKEIAISDKVIECYKEVQKLMKPYIF